jgi:hypothetical protein
VPAARSAAAYIGREARDDAAQHGVPYHLQVQDRPSTTSPRTAAAGIGSPQQATRTRRPGANAESCSLSRTSQFAGLADPAIEGQWARQDPVRGGVRGADEQRPGRGRPRMMLEQLEAFYAIEYSKLVKILVLFDATIEEAEDTAQKAMTDFARRPRPQGPRTTRPATSGGRRSTSSSRSASAGGRSARSGGGLTTPGSYALIRRPPVRPVS